MKYTAEQELKMYAEIDAKIEVIREGSALRTAAELNECYIEDACALLDVNRENLSGTDPDEDFDLYLNDTANGYEWKLDAAGYTTVWNDGYVLYKDLSDEALEFLSEVSW